MLEFLWLRSFPERTRSFDFIRFAHSAQDDKEWWLGMIAGRPESKCLGFFGYFLSPKKVTGFSLPAPFNDNRRLNRKYNAWLFFAYFLFSKRK